MGDPCGYLTWWGWVLKDAEHGDSPWFRESVLPLGELDVPGSGAEGVCIASGSARSSLLEEGLGLGLWEAGGERMPRGGSLGTAPLACALPELGHPGVQLLLVSHLEDDVCPLLHLGERKGQLCGALRGCALPGVGAAPTLTFSTKVYRLSGISRRVQRRTSWMLEQAACSLGFEL